MGDFIKCQTFGCNFIMMRLKHLFRIFTELWQKIFTGRTRDTGAALVKRIPSEIENITHFSLNRILHFYPIILFCLKLI